MIKAIAVLSTCLFGLVMAPNLALAKHGHHHHHKHFRHHGHGHIMWGCHTITKFVNGQPVIHRVCY